MCRLYSAGGERRTGATGEPPSRATAARSRPRAHPKKSPGGGGFQGGRMRQASWLFAVLFFALSSASYGVELKPKVTIAAFGLYGDQSVFESEAKGAARIVADRFGGSPVIVRAN